MHRTSLARTVPGMTVKVVAWINYELDQCFIPAITVGLVVMKFFLLLSRKLPCLMKSPKYGRLRCLGLNIEELNIVQS